MALIFKIKSLALSQYLFICISCI